MLERKSSGSWLIQFHLSALSTILILYCTTAYTFCQRVQGIKTAQLGKKFAQHFRTEAMLTKTERRQSITGSYFFFCPAHPGPQQFSRLEAKTFKADEPVDGDVINCPDDRKSCLSHVIYAHIYIYKYIYMYIWQRKKRTKSARL